MNAAVIANGRRVQADAPVGQTPLQLPREQDYRSVRCGCGTTNCGLYSIWTNEKTVLSCSVPIGHVDDHHITVLEGVEKEVKKFADFMTKEEVEQCGFCSPGMMMQVLAMKKESRTWTDEKTKR